MMVGKSWLRSVRWLVPFVTAVRKQGTMDGGAQLAFYSFQSSWDPSLWDDAVHM